MSHTLYASGGRGLIRYFFLHGSHERTNFASQVAVEARILSFTQSGELISDHSNDVPPRTYTFVEGSLTGADKSQGNIKTNQIVQTLLKNVSVPALVLIEVPSEQVDFPPVSDEPYSYGVVSMLGRSDLRICVGEERDYLERMSKVFLPRFVQAMSSRSGDYLPGDAGNLCKQIAHGMAPLLDDGEFVDFLELYRQRYLGKSVVEKSDILEACLLHIIKIPFDLESSIRQGLIRQD